MAKTQFFVSGVLFFVVTCLIQGHFVVAREPRSCSLLNSTEWIGPITLQTGTKYELMSEHEQDCATEGRKGKCKCTITLQSQNKYQLVGAVNPGWFNLQAGWESEMTATATDEKDLETSTSEECVGPMWGYLKKDFSQKQ